jgi:hypothetical protein
VQQKLVTNDVIVPLYADSLGLPFLRLSDVAIDETLMPTVPAVMARQQSLVPILREGRHVLIASPNPLRSEVEEQLQLRFDASIRQVVCTKASVDQVIAEYYSRETAAAQIAATPQNVAAKKSSGKSSSNEGNDSRLSRAELRQFKLKIGFVAGAFTAMVIIFGGSLFTNYDPTTLQMLGIGIGLAAFGIGYVAAN